MEPSITAADRPIGESGPYRAISSAPTASMITQMSQVYGQDADYASAINVVTTLMCVFTMPVIVALCQL